jgi:predicted RNA-binding Zn-ribbon protein involved in translation (DUF1610 family)
MSDEDWTSYIKRRDGLCLEMNALGFTIVPARGSSMFFCPCCGKTMPTAQTARLVADAVFPLDDVT